MPTVRWQEYLAACACVALLVWAAFFAAYSGAASNNAIRNGRLENRQNVAESSEHNQSGASNQKQSPNAIKLETPSDGRPDGKSANINSSTEYGSAAEWRLNELTCWLVVFTALLAIVAAAQAALFVWQLRYMRDGLKDAAVAAKAAETAAKAADESNKISRDLFIQEHRPWLSISIVPASNLRIDGSGKVSCDMIMTLENHGSSPAINVISAGIDVIYKESEIISTQDEKIRKINSFMQRGRNDGIVLFPKERYDIDITAYGNVPLGAFQTKLNYSGGTPERLLIVGCWKYSFPGGNGITRICYFIGRRTTAGTNYLVTFAGPVIPYGELVFGRGNIGNSAS
jgi:hypothetical protein